LFCGHRRLLENTESSLDWQFIVEVAEAQSEHGKWI